MHFSLLRLYWLRILGAVLALVFAMLYLLDREGLAIGGFAVLALAVTAITVMIRKNRLPASCDLCGSSATISAEYDAGFANARLILNCRRCGRIVNGRPGSMQPRKE